MIYSKLLNTLVKWVLFLILIAVWVPHGYTEPSNVAPIFEYPSPKLLPNRAITIIPDGLGTLNFSFRVVDPDKDSLILTQFEYTLNGGNTWIEIPDTSSQLPVDFKKYFFASSAQPEKAPLRSFQISTNYPNFFGLFRKKTSGVQFRFRAKDTAQNTSLLTTSPLTVDNDFPVVYFTTLQSHASKPDLSGSTDEPIAELTLTIDNQTLKASIDSLNNGWQIPESEFKKPLAYGIYDMRISAKDHWGNIGTFYFPGALTLDSRALLVSADTLFTPSSQPSITGWVSQTNAEVFCTINGNTYPAEVDTVNGRWIIPKWPHRLEEGVYDIEVYSKLDDKISSDTKLNELVIDRTPPQVTVDRVITNNPYPVISGNVSERVWLTIQIGSFRDSLFVPSAGRWRLDSQAVHLTLEGFYDVKVSAKDQSGHIYTDKETNEILFDQSPPRMTYSSPSHGSTSLNSSILKFYFNEAVHAGPGFITLRYQESDIPVFTSSFQNCKITGLGSPELVLYLPDTLPSNHKLKLILDSNAIRDAAGNWFAGIGPQELLFSTTTPQSSLVYKPIILGNKTFAKRDDTLYLAIPFAQPLTLKGGNIWIDLETGEYDSRVKIEPFKNKDTLMIVYKVRSTDQTSNFDIKRIQFENTAQLVDPQNNIISLEGLSLYPTGAPLVQLDGIAPTLDLLAPLPNSVTYFPQVTYTLPEALHKITLNWIPEDSSASHPIRSRTLDSAEMSVGLHKNVLVDSQLVSGVTYRLQIDIQDQAGNKTQILSQNIRQGFKLSGIKIPFSDTLQANVHDTLQLNAVGLDTIRQGGLIDVNEIFLNDVSWKTSGLLESLESQKFLILGLGKHKVHAQYMDLQDSLIILTKKAELKLSGLGTDSLPLGKQALYIVPQTLSQKQGLLKIVLLDSLPRAYKIIQGPFNHLCPPVKDSLAISLYLDTSSLKPGELSRVRLFTQDSKTKKWKVQVTSGNDNYYSFRAPDTLSYFFGIDESTPQIFWHVENPNSSPTEFKIKYQYIDNSTLSALRLRLIRGGKQDSIVALDPNDSLFLLTTNTLDYQGLALQMEAYDGTNWTITPAYEKIIPVSVSLMHPQVAQANRYTLLAFPYDISKVTFENILQDDLGSPNREKWRMFNYELDFQEITGNYPLSTGKAYWLNQKTPVEIDLDSGFAQTVSLLNDITVPIKPGWNSLSLPFPFVGPRKVFTQANPNFNHYFFSDSGWLPQEAVDSLYPWRGFLIWNEQSNPLALNYVFPKYISWRNTSSAPPEPTPRTTSLPKLLAKESSATQMYSWLFWIEDAQGPQGFVHLGMGYPENKKQIWPTPFADKLPLYIYSSQNPNEYFMSDLRPNGNEGHIWQVKFPLYKKHPLKLGYRSHKTPEQTDWKFYLKQSSTDQFLPLENTQSKTIYLKDSTFLILAGPPDFIQAQQKELNRVSSFSVLNPFPNPFNTQLNIPLILPNNHSEPLIINVYRPNGKILYTQEFRAPYTSLPAAINTESISGLNSRQVLWTWAGRDKANLPVPTGIYYVTIKTGKIKINQKILRM